MINAENKEKMTNLIKNLKELGLKGFMKKWKQGIMRITPEQLLRSEIKGYIGSILGTILAGYFFIFVYERMWTIAIILGFGIIIQGSQLIGKYQQLDALKKFQSIESVDDILKEVQNAR
jgi:hypothetical protein